MQGKSLKEVQPQICEAMGSLLLETSAQEDIQVQYSRSSCPNYRKKPFTTRKSSKPSVKKDKSCVLCKAAGRAYLGHDISSYWFISKFDNLEISNAFRVEVNGDFEICGEEVCDDEIKSVNISLVPTIPANPQVFTPSDQQVSLATAQQVQC